jgi:hypothetical protein
MDRDVAAPTGNSPQPLAVPRNRFYGMDASPVTDSHGHSVHISTTVGANINRDLTRPEHFPHQQFPDIVAKAHLK